jgi:hypothetical protein
VASGNQVITGYQVTIRLASWLPERMATKWSSANPKHDGILVM